MSDCRLSIMLKIVLVAHLTYENQVGSVAYQNSDFCFFGTPIFVHSNKSTETETEWPTLLNPSLVTKIVGL